MELILLDFKREKKTKLQIHLFLFGEDLLRNKFTNLGDGEEL